MRLLISLALILAIAVPRAAAAVAPSDSLALCLKKAAGPRDSLIILYNLFDLEDRMGKRRMLKPLYATAKKSGDLRAQLDILRQAANLYLGNDTAQIQVLEAASKLPPSDERIETELFIRLLIVTTEALYNDEDKKADYLDQFIAKFRDNDKEPLNPLEEIERLYSVCIMFDSSVHGPILEKYINDSDKLIEQLPFGLYALRNMFYAHGALIYSNANEPERAVEADRKLLKLIDELEQKYVEQGRVFRNFRSNRYICYRRMLSNYKALSPEEVQDLYHKILELAAQDKEIENDLDSNHLAEIYTLMAQKNYQRALPLLKKIIETDLSTPSVNKPKIYSMAVEAAEVTGDTVTMLNTLKRYNSLLERQIDSRSINDYRKLRVTYDYDDLIKQRTELEQSNKREHRVVVVLAVAAAVFLLGLYLLQLQLYRRSRKRAKELDADNEVLKQERKELIETQNILIASRDDALKADETKGRYLTDISHEVEEPLNAIAGFTQLIVDSVDTNTMPWLEKYAGIVTLNTDLVLTLVNDVITLSASDKDQLSVVVAPVSVNTICETVIENVKLRLNEGVSITYAKAGAPDTMVCTDAQRVEQVLLNLLKNAAKFTTNGSITLDYTLLDNNSRISFIVTDTGPGVPTDKAELIFERFVKLNPTTQGVGLGLPICRLIARLLNGDVVLDTTYTAGARFIFTISI